MRRNKLALKMSPLLLVGLILSCSNNNQSKTQQMDKYEHKNHSAQEHKNHSHGGHEFNNKVTIEELAKKFESKERDSLERPEKVLKFMGNINGKKIVDIGAGTGYYAVRFANSGAYVIAADVSEQFQNYLKNRMEKDNIKNIELRKTPYDSPELKDNEVDMVFIANTYHHIENRINYFSKVKRGMKKNGELIVLDYFNVDLPENVTAPPREIRVSIDQAVAELKESGFRSFEIEVNLLPYHYLIKAK